MGRNQKLRSNRHAQQDGKCFWCGHSAVLLAQYPNRMVKTKKNSEFLDVATIEHLDDRYGFRRRTDLKIRTVMACMFCNLLGAILSERIMRHRDPLKAKFIKKFGGQRYGEKREKNKTVTMYSTSENSISTLADVWPKHDSIEEYSN